MTHERAVEEKNFKNNSGTEPAEDLEQAMLGLLVMLFLTGVSIVIYFVPTMVAFARYHPQFVAIAALNFLAGWTFIGWVAAFVWALTAFPQQTRPRRYSRN